MQNVIRSGNKVVRIGNKIVANRFGNGLKFDGVNDRLDSELNSTLDNYAFNNTKNYTFEMLVRINGNGSQFNGNNMLVSNTAEFANQVSLIMAYTNSRQLRFFVAGAGVLVASCITAPGFFNYGDLLSLAGTVENTDTNTIVTLYVNGLQVATATAALGASASGFNKFQLGGGTTAFRFGNATIYRTRFFTDYLASPLEVVELSQGKVPTDMLSSMTLDVHYNKNRGTKVFDKSSEGTNFDTIDFSDTTDYAPADPATKAWRDSLGNPAF